MAVIATLAYKPLTLPDSVPNGTVPE
jgi:hypothetical protein